ncbi:AGRL2-like protein [Mya arenaria]|uniref:AGRL2-like protein n=1 Tax=Mya arenaria TaxID=6604 RepID=A0ABY7FWU7_MYAAR|nr:AGRL2-like protein [Mya arenaria]
MASADTSFLVAVVCLLHVSSAWKIRSAANLRPQIYATCINSTLYTLPDCRDHPDGYGCDCGAGFHWNTQVPRPAHNGTILSYKHDVTGDLLSMRNGESNLYINSRKRKSKVSGEAAEVPQGGEFVLGQASRGNQNDFDERVAFVGDLSHLNIWSFVLTEHEIDTLFSSCDFMHCGDAVSWTEFRRGTRGAMRMRWPSGALRAQCNEQIVENIRWTRTPALDTISIPCPADVNKRTADANTTAYGTRPCNLTDENEGEWDTANIDSCISESLRRLKYKAEMIVLKVQQWSDGTVNYAKASQIFITLDETKQFIQIVCDVVDNLLSEKHELGWNATQPPGTEGDNLLKVMETFAHVVSRILQNQITDGNIHGTVGFEDAYLYAIRQKIAFIKIAGLRIRGMTIMLPNHDLRATGKKSKENNLNTPIIAMFLHAGHLGLGSNLTAPITFNISNPECVRLEHGTILAGKTSSATASLHRNLGMSVVCGQLVFMVGIERYDHTVICEIFAVCLHYFFLANFSWLMNEAFNLYIVITYSSHAHDGHSEAGSMLRYYILGWIIPAVLVGSFVGSQGENYYAKDMCWVSWDNLWLFVGPALGIIAVTIMVLIFTAKEHNENSYTKSEKNNKSIILLMKGLWTQIILIAVAWSFAFISLKMNDRIIKYIFGLFNSLQKKKKTLSAHGFDDADDRSLDSQPSTHLVEKDRLEALALDPRPRRRRDQAARNKRRQRLKRETSPDEDEQMASDCEMITSV